MWRSGSKNGSTFRGCGSLLSFANKVHATDKLVAVDNDLHPIAVSQLADGAAGESFRTDMSDASTRADPGKTGVGDDCDLFSPFEKLESRSELIRLFHP